MSKRLDKLLSLIPDCNVLADVGCDHGYVGIQALADGKARQAVFVDVSRPSLDKAAANCPDELTDRASFVCQDGLGKLFCDVAVIAGMGGLEIISILTRAENPPHILILQPNRSACDVRKYLNARYEIVYDGKIFDGKFYDMILAEQNSRPVPLTEMELQFGKTNLSRPTEDFRLFLARERAKLSKILQRCNDAKVQARLDLTNRAIAAIGGKL